MKKIIILITLISLSVIICSCGNKDKSNKKEFHINEEKPYVGIWDSEAQHSVPYRKKNCGGYVEGVDYLANAHIYLFEDQKCIYTDYRSYDTGGGFYYLVDQATDTKYVISVYKYNGYPYEWMLFFGVYDRETDTFSIEYGYEGIFDEYEGQIFTRSSDDPGEYDDHIDYVDVKPFELILPEK